MADGTLKVGTITNSAGSGNITIGSGVTINVNRPVFEVYQSSSQTPSSNTWTKLTFTGETFDTDSAWSDSKFTVPNSQAGTYVFTLDAGGSDSGTGLDIFRLAIYKNGSLVKFNTCLDTDGTSIQTAFFSINAVLDLAVGDYIEAYINVTFGGTFTTLSNASGTKTRFSGFKLGA